MLKFISFGSGSSGNCYYLATPTDVLLIDIGVGLRGLKKSCKDYGCSLSQVHHVLITHDHADHIKSVGSFSHDYSVPVYATKEVHEGINRNYCVTKKIAPELTRYLEKGVTRQIGDFMVTPFAVPHDSSDNVGYLVEAEGVVFCVMTDVGVVTDEMKKDLYCPCQLSGHRGQPRHRDGAERSLSSVSQRAHSLSDGPSLQSRLWYSHCREYDRAVAPCMALPSQRGE